MAFLPSLGPSEVQDFQATAEGAVMLRTSSQLGFEHYFVSKDVLSQQFVRFTSRELKTVGFLNSGFEFV